MPEQQTQTQARTQTTRAIRSPARTVDRQRKRRAARAVTAALVLVACALLTAAGMEIRDRRSFATQVSHGPGPSPDRLGSSASAHALSVHTRLASARTPAEVPTTIGLIGDSWVSGDKLDAPLAESLGALGLSHVQVRSFGHPGAMSKRIFENLFADPANEFSSAPVLLDDSVRHCIVIAGVNDTASYIGADFYAHHVTVIARALLDRGIRPLIVEVPEYGIEEVPRTLQSTLKAAVFRTLFDDGEVDVVARYRAELERQLVRAGLRDRVALIGFAPVATDYGTASALYEDPTHLNASGRRVFAGLLAKVLERELASEIPPSGVLRARSTNPLRESPREATDVREPGPENQAVAFPGLAYQPSAS